jgi:hypothetical protein
MSADRNQYEWVRPERVAALFEVSLSAVYHGDAGLNEIRSAWFGRSRRWYWPDAIALSERRLREAMPVADDEGAVVRRLFGVRRFRRRA